MHAITVTEPGGPDSLHMTEMPDPIPGPGEVVLDVAATAVNRADTLQRQGLYPPPPGVTDVIGLECSGTVRAVGPGVDRWSVGDRACALLAGGGYATQVCVPAPQLMSVPDGIDLVDAAALPEALATVWSNIFMDALLRDEETLLVHGGSGGLGTFAIQLAVTRGHRVLTTVGTAAKAEACLALGADVAINYREQDFATVVKEITDRRGVDVVLDVMGASYLTPNVAVLATGGRLAIIGMQGGTKGELDIGRLLMRRGRIIATALRPRPVEEKGAICAELEREVWPLIAAGQVRPVIDRALPLTEAADAHRHLEASEHTGKIVLTT